MKTSDHLRSAVIGYLSIGVVIGLTQLGLNKVFAPPCNGIVKHTLWERDFSPDTHFLLRVGLNVAQWLPDLYFQLVKGDMATRDYLLGGYHCEPTVVSRSLLPSLSNNLLDTPSFKGLGLHGDRPAGSLSESLLKQAPAKPLDTSRSQGLSLSGDRLDTPNFKGLGLHGDRPPGSLSESLLKQAPAKPLDTSRSQGLNLSSDHLPGLSESLVKQAPTKPTVTLTPAPKPLQFESLLQRQSQAPLTLSQNSTPSDEVARQTLKTWRDPNTASSPDSQFVTLEALPGVSLAVPRDWLVVGSEEIQQHVTAGEAVYGSGKGIPKAENTQAFRPPTDVEGVGIAVVSTPATLTPQELRTASDAQIHEWAAIIEQQARRGVEAQGLKLLPLTDISRERVGGWLGLVFKTRIVDAQGAVFEQTQIHIPTSSRTIMLNLSYGKGAPPVFRPILAHARETLRIVETDKP